MGCAKVTSKVILEDSCFAYNTMGKFSCGRLNGDTSLRFSSGSAQVGKPSKWLPVPLELCETCFIVSLAD